MKRSVLITGGSGFVGRNLVENLSGYTITAPSSKELNLLDQASVDAYFDKHSFDIVIHCAGFVISRNFKRNVSDIVDANLRMHHNLMRHASAFDRVFCFGSGAEYDKEHYQPAMAEDFFGTHTPTDPYGFSKFCIAYDIRQRENVINLRLFGCFGPYEDWEVRFISNALCKVMCGMDITMHQNIAFDYVYVKDVARVLEQLIEKKKLAHTEYNLTSGTVVEIKDIAQMILKKYGPSQELSIAHDGIGNEYSGDNTRLMDELPGFSFTLFEEALDELQTWYTSRKKEIDCDLLKLNK